MNMQKFSYFKISEQCQTLTLTFSELLEKYAKKTAILNF
jgi:hypothetical protein